jgi:hypothetical protein
MACRWLVLKAGLTADEALKILTRETQAEDGALDLYEIINWPDEYERRQFRGFIRTYLRFVYHAGADRFLVWPVWKARFDFDCDQVAALVAKVTKPKQKPMRKRGRKTYTVKQAVLDEAERVRAEGDTPKAASLREFAKGLTKGKKKQRLPSEITIRTWLREPKPPR